MRNGWCFIIIQFAAQDFVGSGAGAGVQKIGFRARGTRGST